MKLLLVLHVLSGPLRGMEFAFHAPACIILGRSHRCDVFLGKDESVSPRHCKIEMDDNGLWIQDLGSENGTFLNLENIALPRNAQTAASGMITLPDRRPVMDGDEIRIGINVLVARVFETTSEKAGSSNPCFPCLAFSI
ncbi:MAG: FHA domain-containing protein [Gemmataceae bacterium]